MLLWHLYLIISKDFIAIDNMTVVFFVYLLACIRSRTDHRLLVGVYAHLLCDILEKNMSSMYQQQSSDHFYEVQML